MMRDISVNNLMNAFINVNIFLTWRSFVYLIYKYICILNIIMFIHNRTYIKLNMSMGEGVDGLAKCSYCADIQRILTPIIDRNISPFHSKCTYICIYENNVYKCNIFNAHIESVTYNYIRLGIRRWEELQLKEYNNVIKIV